MLVFGVMMIYQVQNTAGSLLSLMVIEVQSISNMFFKLHFSRFM